ncbi:hypothetical protein T492DRAFT_842475 [Pavlovales sp. CCMP2436]|nr:hypothetical protein T492DRAFT_842475 [Pavlovales sp. CCMP2436]
MAPATSSIVSVPKIPVSTKPAAASAGPSTPIKGKSPASSTTLAINPRTPKPAAEAMTITGVPIIQSNPHPSTHISNEDPGALVVQTRAAEMSAVAEANEVAHLKSQAPAWIEMQRPSIRAVDLLSIKDLNQFVSDTRDQYRLSYLANAQIPPSRYTLTFISLTSVRNLVYSEYNIQKARQIHEQDALKTISARFKDSGKAKNIEQKRVDDALLLATEKKAKAAALRKQQRKEAAARKVVADTLAGIVDYRRRIIYDRANNRAPSYLIKCVFTLKRRNDNHLFFGRNGRLDGLLLSAMDRDGLRWIAMVRDGPRWIAMVRDGTRWTAMDCDGPRWYAMVVSMDCDSSITTMVPYRANNMELRSRRYNLGATRMRNINMRIGSLNEIILEVYGSSVDLPMILRGNLYEEPGTPPSLRRIPNSQTGFERAYNRMMRDAKKNEHTPSARNNKHIYIFNHMDFSDRGINLKHRGALRYIVQEAIKNKKWIINFPQVSQTPSLTKGITYDVSIATVITKQSAANDEEKEYGFSRQARVEINKAKDLEGIMDLRYTEDDEKKDNEKIGKMVAESDKNKKGGSSPPSDRTVFYQDGLITFSEVTAVTTTSGASGSNLFIADAPTMNCLIAGFYHRLTVKRDEIENNLKLLPVQPKGRPRAGEIRDSKSAEERTRLNREHKNIIKRTDGLLDLNERVQILGGVKHTDLHLMQEMIQLSGANSRTIISPLYPKFGSYLHVDNPNPITGKVHGVIKTPVKMLLTTPTHVESFTASTFGFVTTDTEIIKLDVAEMTAKYAELITSDATPGCCIGKISEVFSLSSQEEMKDMLSQKIEGLLAINTSTVDFSTVCSEKIIKCLRIETPNLNTDFITAEKIHETLTNVYTTKIARSYEVDDRGFEKLQAPTVPKILTFPEARFWLMCGVTFEAHIAMVSYDSVPISWDETSHTKEGGIRHYAKAVGVGMSTSLNSRFHISGTEVQAQQYYALALEDPNLDETRVNIRTVGENTIEIEHPLAGVNTTAHAVCQAFVLPGCLELVMDGIYCLMDQTLDYERLLLPTFMIKDSGSMPDVAATPTLSTLRTTKIRMDFSSPETRSFLGLWWQNLETLQ